MNELVNWVKENPILASVLVAVVVAFWYFI